MYIQTLTLHIVLQVMTAVVQLDARPGLPSEDEIMGGKFPGIEDYMAVMQECWSRDANDRPSFKAIVERLKKVREKAWVWWKAKVAEEGY